MTFDKPEIIIVLAF